MWPLGTQFWYFIQWPCIALCAIVVGVNVVHEVPGSFTSRRGTIHSAVLKELAILSEKNPSLELAEQHIASGTVSLLSAWLCSVPTIRHCTESFRYIYFTHLIMPVSNGYFGIPQEEHVWWIATVEMQKKEQPSFMPSCLHCHGSLFKFLNHHGFSYLPIMRAWRCLGPFYYIIAWRRAFAPFVAMAVIFFKSFLWLHVLGNPSLICVKCDGYLLLPCKFLPLYSPL